METVTLQAPDISCGHCVGTIRGAVTRLPGVEFIDADMPAKTVTLRYEPSQTSRAELEQAMAEEDYPVAP